MTVFTNMAWPDDPYGTGQLWRSEPLLLAGFGMCWAGGRGRVVSPASYAMVYLRLHPPGRYICRRTCGSGSVR
jgi:hypothetical protein